MRAVSPKLVLNAIALVAMLASRLCVRAEMARSVAAPVIPASRLRPLTAKSGYIFAGTVTSISAGKSGDKFADAKDMATIRIAFHVDEGVRGVRTGQSLTIREWAGVWEYGQRYRVGEKVFLFLYAPSKLGLTSAVGGWQGRFSINRTGGVGVNPILLAVGPQRPSHERVPGRITIPLLDFERAVRLAGGNAP